MKRISSVLMILMVFCLVLSVAAFAQKAEKASSPACPEEKVAIATGISTGTYSKSVKSLVKLNEALLCEYTASTGGFENVDLLTNRVVDAGLVQDDLMEYLARNNPMVRKKLRALVSLYGSSMHIIVKSEGFHEKSDGYFSKGKVVAIRTLGDLKGRPVAAFASAVPTATIINERAGLQMQIYEVGSDQEGLKLVKDGKVAAFLAMGGMPIGWLAKEKDSGLTLANVEDNYIKVLGAPYYAHKLSYKNLGVYGVTAVTARNSIIVFDYRGPKADKLVELRELIRENLLSIKESRESHPAWQDVDNIDDTYWEKYNPPAVAMSPLRREPESPKVEVPEKPTPPRKKGR